MWIGSVTERMLEVFVPSWGEINISLLAAVLLVLLVSLLQHTLLEDRQARKSGSRKGQLSRISETDKITLNDPSGRDANPSSGMTPPKEVATRDWDSDFVYMIRLELLAAKNLLAAHLNGTSDPYAIIVCAGEKRFSTLVPGTRNPMWGEEFDFYVEDLPVEIKVSIHDWDIVWKSTCLGTTTLLIGDEGQNEAIWYPLDSAAGQVCIQTITKKYPISASGSLNGFASTVARKIKDKRHAEIGTEVRQKPGPLQTIFDLPPDEVILHSYSCALERSFLYHGRMFVSDQNICFHSNVFAKQLKVILPYEDIEEIKRSQHAFINPAITIILRAGSGGHGVPPLASTDGRAKYKFASYWNRNHVYRALQRAAQKFKEMKEQAQQEQQQSTLRAQSSSFRHLREAAVDSTDELPTASATEVKTFVPFLQEEVLTQVIKEELPVSAEKVFRVCFADDSKFTEAFRALRKDTELQIEKWHPTGQYVGENRKITFRALCNNPMCPPDSAMTEYQHASFSEDKKILVRFIQRLACMGFVLTLIILEFHFVNLGADENHLLSQYLETVQQCHDIPFGSYFEVHARWTFESSSDSSCTLVLKVGAHFKKWCIMQGKIKAGTITEVKGESKGIIEVMRKFLEEANAAEQHSTSDDAPTGEDNGEQAGATPTLASVKAKDWYFCPLFRKKAVWRLGRKTVE
ncbi:hypothetical protein R1sor_018258 [Riccia sorocarpa]|uniref:C2 domain-containing protein n=1 Tax=Riccia sorocarpa TaxID=122646 RepID=A0ABD3I9L8_9MARC